MMVGAFLYYMKDMSQCFLFPYTRCLYKVLFEPITMVLRQSNAIQDHIPISSLLLKYMSHMNGIDVANQLRASYSS